MEEKRIAIGVDVGGSHVSCRLYDLMENRLLTNSLFNQPIDHAGSANDILNTLEDLLRPALSEIEINELAGIGLAMPGPFDYLNGIGLFSGENVKYIHLNQVNIREELSKRLGIQTDAIRFINDATAFALGEFFNGDLQKASRGLGITLGTGFGAAFLSHGIPVIRDRAVPKEGCLWHLPFKDGIADDYFSTRGLLSRFASRAGYRVEGVKQIAALYHENKFARSVFTEFGIELARFLSPWVRSFKVEKLVIGGNISKAFSLFEIPFGEELRKEALEIGVRPSGLLEDSASIGAAVLLKNEFYSSIKDQLKYM